MKKFILLLHEDMPAMEKLSPQEMEKLVQSHMDWAQKLRDEGHFLAGDGLSPEGKQIHGKDSLVKDGPYLETKEMIGGYYLLQGADLASITEIAKSCPCHLYGGVTEVRPILDYE